MDALDTRTDSTLHRLAAGGLAAVAALVLAACGSSSTTKTSASTSPSTPQTTAAASGVTIATATVPGVGTVLVNAKDGRTLYLLTSEQGGKLTCTDANGCTTVWPDTELPKGVTAATAGMGVDASKLGTVTSADGNLYVTYAGYPLYEFSHDSSAGDAKGQGISSFGGTWWVVSAAGTPVTASATATTTAAATPTSMGY
jgi:predicted lipoprotein with Yx(FWY)xxD motif